MTMPAGFRNHNGLTWGEFPHLAARPEIRHAFFTRQGGFSSDPYAGLNVGDHVGDSPEAVTQNRKAVANALGFEDLFAVRQAHGVDIHIIKDANPGYGELPPEADAIICNRPGVALLIQTADCQAIFLFDRKKKIVANIHAGWRGNVGNIIGRTLEVMGNRFGCDPKDILAGISPSLGPCCAEFVNYRTEMPEKYWPHKDDRMHFNLWAISRDQMLASGIPAKNIAVAGLCTRCDTGRFFSYRAEKTTGRLAAVIGLGAYSTSLSS